MSTESTPSLTPAPAAVSPSRAALDLFLISFLILFLELACIRWFPAHVLFLTFFTNIVLLASFLGISLGCLAAGQKRDYLGWTPALLATLVVSAIGVEALFILTNVRVGVETQVSSQVVYFG